MMNVLHINSNYLGTTLHQLMIRELNKHSQNVVFVPIFDKTKIVIEPDENVKVRNCFSYIDRFFFPLKQHKIYGALQKSVTLGEFDLTHAYTLFTDGNIAFRLKKKYGTPYVVAVRNTDVNDFFKKRVLLRRRGLSILANAEMVFFLSESYKDLVLKNYVPDRLRDTIAKKTKIIPNGIDDFWFNNMYSDHLAPSGKEIRLIVACGVDKNKKIVTIQKAMKSLASCGYKPSLTVAGKIVHKKEYKRLSKDKNTVFVGNKTKEELITLYRNSDIFVMPSRKESFGLVYAEALSQGLPVIYTKGQGFDKQFDDGIVGYPVNPNSDEDIKNSIIDIISNYAYLSQNTTKCVSKFMWNRLVNQYIREYEAIINK